MSSSSLPYGNMTTLDVTGSDAAPESHLSLCIVHHPNLSRVGEVCPVRALDQHETVTLSRVDPLFINADDVSHPMADPRLSRTPLRIQFDGAYFVFSSVSNSYRVEGRSVGDALRIPAIRAWKDGLLIELGEHASVLLRSSIHAQPLPRCTQLVGVSDAMCQARALTASMGDVDGPILLQGEFGVGRSHLARALHEASPNTGQMVAVDLAEVAPSRLETTLSTDILARAQGGTLLLSGVDGLPPEGQPALRRILRLAAQSDPPTLIIATTQLELQERVDQGVLAPELHHQLSQVRLTVPPLRERREDIMPIFLHALRKRLAGLGAEDRLAARGTNASWLPLSVTRALFAHRWPGNVTELVSTASRVALESQARRVALLPQLSPSTRPKAKPRRVALAVDRVKSILRRNQWNIRRSAQDLGVARNTLISFMDRSPAFRRGKDLSDTELHRVIAVHGRDPVALADALGVSPQGIRLRLAKMDRG